MAIKEKKKKRGFLDGYETYDTSHGFGSKAEWRAAWNERMSHNKAKATLEENDPLVIMGFSSMPSKVELDKRYRELVMIHHPDKGGDTKQFIKIHAAWSLLTENI